VQVSSGRARLPRSGDTPSIHRDDLVRRLSSVADDITLVLVVAPPGYGKTTAVGQWARKTPSQVAWLTVTGQHQDRRRFVHDLALALELTRSAGDGLGRLAASLSDAPPEKAPAGLVSAVAAAGRPVTIVLDDLHLLRTRAALDLVLAVAVRLPPGCRIVAIGDRQPRLQVGRLLSEGRCLDIGPEQLAFSREETQALLAASGVDLDSEAVDELQRRTEGWVAGLQRAVTALTARGTHGDVREVAGTNAAMTDYFSHEVLSLLSVDALRFLMRTAVLDRFCGPLCDAALRSSGSGAWIGEVAALGLFLVPLDDRGEWFRYHRLFAEMLRGELRRREPGEDRRILQEAALWYERRGLPEEAVRHALDASDAVLAARLIATHTQELNSRGRLGQLRSLLERLDQRILERYPPLAVMAAWVWALTGEALQARWALRMAEGSTFDGPMPDGSASLESGIFIIRAALAPHGVDGMLPDARRAVALEPPDSPWRTLARLLEGAAHLVTGSTPEASVAFEDAARAAGGKQRPGASFALGMRALTAAADGDWPTAATCAHEAQRLVGDSLSGSMGSITVFAADAQVAAHRGNTRRALYQLREAERLYRDPSPCAFPWLAVHIAIVLGRLQLTLGDVAAAENKLNEARRGLALLPTQGVLRSQVEAFAAQLESGAGGREGELEAGLTAAELRVLRLLPTHYTLGEIGDELVVSRNTIKSQVAAIYRKLDVANRAEAVRRAQEAGLLRGNDGRSPGAGSSAGIDGNGPGGGHSPRIPLQPR
jgi:LuxR family maltose regulon positive regulatory protein